MYSYCVWAQSPDWTIVPKTLNFSTSAVTTGTMPGTYTTPYTAANCGYDNTGSILFYVVDGKVYDKTGVLAGNLSAGFGNNGRDIIIIPDPGNCNAHLIIHTSSDIIVGSGCNYIKKVLVTRITHTGNALTIQQNYFAGTDIFDCYNLSLAICVSKPQANGNRFLYAVGNAFAYKYLISSTGISFVSSFNQNTSSNAADAEVSPTGDKLAWANAFGGNAYSICWINLDANGDFLTIQTKDASPSLYPAYGLEFIDNTKVMVAAGSGTNGGIYEANLTSIPTSTLKISNSMYYYSNLEKALDGKIYTASANGLTGIDASYNTTPISMTVTSNASGFFTLPKQLDYENYSQVFSCTPPCLPNITISGNYTQPLTQSQNWIRNNGTTTIPSNATVKLDAEPTAGYVELDPGFETQAGCVFIAQALDGCGPGIPMIIKKQGTKQNEANAYADSQGKDAQFKLIIYPNPTGGPVTIQHSTAIKQLQVFDMMGRMLFNISTKGSTLTKIDLSKEANGIYIVHADGQAVQKIIKQ